MQRDKDTFQPGPHSRVTGAKKKVPRIADWPVLQGIVKENVKLQRGERKRGYL